MIFIKYKWDKQFLYWGITAFLVIAAGISFFMIIHQFNNFSDIVTKLFNVLMPIIFGLVMAYLLSPIVTFFQNSIINIINKKNKIKNIERMNKIVKIISVFSAILIMFLFILGIIALVLPQLLNSVQSIVENFPQYVRNANDSIVKLLADNEKLATFAERILTEFSETFIQFAKNQVLPQLNDVIVGVTSGVLVLVNFLKNFVVGIIVSVYVLFSKDLFAAQCKKILYACLRIKAANKTIATVRKANKIFGGFITGKLLDSLIIGIITFIIMNIFGWPYPMLISVIIAVTNIIPFFGPFIGAIPSAIIILMVEPITTIYFVIFILLLQQFDGNILGPKILGDSTGLSAFWVVFSILLFGGVFGFVGMVIGVPTFAVIYVLVSEKIAKTLKEKDLPSDTKIYENLEKIEEESKELVKYKT